MKFLSTSHNTDYLVREPNKLFKNMKEKIKITPDKIISAKAHEEIKELQNKVNTILAGIFLGYDKKLYESPPDNDKDAINNEICSKLQEKIELELIDISEENKPKFLEILFNKITKPDLPMKMIKLMPEDLKMALQDIVERYQKN